MRLPRNHENRNVAGHVARGSPPGTSSVLTPLPAALALSAAMVTAAAAGILPRDDGHARGLPRAGRAGPGTAAPLHAIFAPCPLLEPAPVADTRTPERGTGPDASCLAA
jgi:hypothetical protein